jgi:hypothetical protein
MRRADFKSRHGFRHSIWTTLASSARLDHFSIIRDDRRPFLADQRANSDVALQSSTSFFDDSFFGRRGFRILTDRGHRGERRA